MATEAAGQEAEDFEPDAAGWAKRWQSEFSAATSALEAFREQGVKVDKVFRDERDDSAVRETRWNLYTANIQRMVATLYGNTPKADVSRRFGDAVDDVARVAGEVAERLLHTDLEKRGDTAAEAFGNALLDWLVPGAGFVRVRYAATFAPVPAQSAQLHPVTGQPVPGTEVAAGERVASEEAPIDYIHWRDVMWSPCRVWSELSWIAFAADMPKGPFVKRFGKKAWATVPKQSRKEKEEDKAVDPWARARVWEIWHKEAPAPVEAKEDAAEEAAEAPAEEAAEADVPQGRVFFYVEGHPEVLDIQDDPLKLDGFWPCPRPLFSNLTTSKLVPRSGYYLAQDLYLEINRLSSRIDVLQRAIKVAGTYDASNPEVARVLEETVQNELLPSANWAAFQQNGGFKGAIDFLPLEAIAAALGQLRDYRQEVINALFQVTGWSDIMRGQATAGGATATEQAVKARFGSVLLQRMQDEFARFVSEAQALKLEVISKHFQPQTIIERSNARYVNHPDAKLLEPAVQLLKSQYYCYRVEVKPESISLTDFAQLKQDRTEVITAIATFFQAAAPIAQGMPGSMPFLLELLQSGLAGLRGSSTMEGVLDAAIAKMEAQQKQAAAQPQQPAPPDPKVQAAQIKQQGDAMKAQADMQKEQFKASADLQRIAAETQAHDAQEQSQANWNTQEALRKAQIAHAYKPAEVPKPPGGLP